MHGMAPLSHRRAGPSGQKPSRRLRNMCSLCRNIAGECASPRGRLQHITLCANPSLARSWKMERAGENSSGQCRSEAGPVDGPHSSKPFSSPSVSLLTVGVSSRTLLASRAEICTRCPISFCSHARYRFSSGSTCRTSARLPLFVFSSARTSPLRSECAGFVRTSLLLTQKSSQNLAFSFKRGYFSNKDRDKNI
jgi:hypothetical protein